MASKKGAGSAILGQYDKILLVVGIALLGLSAFAYITGKGKAEEDKSNFSRVLSNLKPEHPEVADVSADLQKCSNVVSRIGHPVQIANDTSKKVGFFVPELRIWCANNACRFPIPPEAEKCPFCGTEQVVQPVTELNADSDADGLPDDWERKYGLNPQDASDAGLDSDEDGFTNIAEFQAGTDPTDAKSHPDLSMLIHVAKIEATVLPLKFMSKMTLPNGKHKCTFNYIYENPKTGKKDVVTLSAYEGENIKNDGLKIDSGYKFDSLEKRSEKKFDPKFNRERTIDTYFAKVFRNEKSFVLEENKEANDTDVRITFQKDFGDNGEIVVEGGADFRLGEKVFHVVKVDKEALTAVIRCEADKSEVTVTKDGASK